MPYFHVSHARGDDDCYVGEFFEDLHKEVAGITGTAGPAGRAQIGFISSDTIEGGDDWPHELATSLSTCQVFIPLCSPRYFFNEIGGKQWWVFRERLRRYAAETGQQAPSLVPLLWAHVEGSVAPSVDFFPVDPAQPGRPLRQYLRLRPLREPYRAFIRRLAERVVTTARAHELRAYDPMPTLAQTPNAFTVLDGLTPAGRRVHFVVAAATREEMSQVREQLDRYGPQTQDWSPYRPVLDRPLADHARAVAGGRMLGSDVTDLSGLPDRIRQADRDNNLVVVLVDPWSTRLEPQRRILTEADHAGLTAAAVLVPASRDDPETDDNRDELQFEVRQTIANYVARIDSLFRSDIQTVETFDADLAGVLEEGRNRLFKSGQPRPASPGPPVGERPILHGP